MTDADELRRAHTTILDQAIQHGAFGYHVYRGLKNGQVTSIIFAATSPEVIGEIDPVISEMEQRHREAARRATTD